MIEINWTPATLIFVLQLVVAVFLPILVALVTTKVTSPFRKALALAALSFIAALVGAIVEALVNQTSLDLIMLIIGLFANFVIAVSSYFGLWSRPKTVGGTSISQDLVANAGRKAKHL